MTDLELKFAQPITLTAEEAALRDAAWLEFLGEPGTPLYLPTHEAVSNAKLGFWRAWSLGRAVYR